MRRARSLPATATASSARSIVGFRDPEPQSPQRDIRRATGELRVVIEHLRRIATGNQEQVESLIVDDGRNRNGATNPDSPTPCVTRPGC